MEPLTHLVSTLAEAAYGVRREGSRVVFSPSPPPEHRPLLASWKAALPHALEEGERLPARELLRLERLACILLAFQEGLPPLTWATFYYEDRHEPERVLAPGPNLVPHLRWRARNLPEARRVHLGATDGRLILDLEAPKGELSPGLLAVSVEAGERWGLPGALDPLEKTQGALGGSPQPCA